MSNGLSSKMLTILVMLISTAIVLDKAYGLYIDAFFRLSLSSEYIYLLPLSMTVMAVFILTFLKKGEITGVNIIRLIIFISFVSISILLYVVSDNIIEYMFELKTLSIIFFIWSLLSLVFNSKSILLGFLLPLTLLLLIPLPHYILSKISMMYTSGVSANTVVLMNTVIDYSPTNVVIKFIDYMGLQKTYEISLIGINCITIVLIIAPIIGYIVSYVKASITDKLLITIAALWIASVIVLLGDSLRILLAVFIGKWNYRIGELLIQQISSIPHIALALLIPIYLVTKKSLVQTSSRRNTIVSETINKRWVISIVIMIMIAIAYPIITSTILHEISGPTVVLKEFPRYLKEHIIAEYNISYSKSTPYPIIRANKLFNVSYILISYRGYNLTGYIERAHVQDSFVQWPLSIMAQGYRVIDKWVEICNVSITYILISRSDHYLLLAYTVYAYPLDPQNTSNIIYARASLFAEVNLENYRETASVIKDLLNSVDLLELETEKYSTSYFDIVEYVASVSILLSIIALILMNSNKLLSYIVERIRRGG
ncbi:MAG: hypothetical protein DRO40_08295 [Thermoprotei archaeon]|nr:MAG: hypothetical protein DRO40_08295 [Thermoprotei archaeon]